MYELNFVAVDTILHFHRKERCSMGLLNKPKPREKPDLWAEDSLSSSRPHRGRKGMSILQEIPSRGFSSRL